MRWVALAFTLFCLASTAPLSAQQFRAAWVDVFHDGMQSSSQVDTMIATLVAGRYNAVIVQVLAFMDAGTTTALRSHGAYWQSTTSIVPWCYYTTQAFDPLGYLCTQAHANGIQVHAWLGGSAGGIYRVSQAWPPAVPAQR